MARAKHLLMTLLVFSTVSNEAAFADAAQDCESLDSEQRRLNDEYAHWKRIYPFSSDLLISCVRRAKTDDVAGQCMITACSMATLGATPETNEGCIDFTAQLAAVGTRSEALKTRKRNYPGCSFVVPNDMNE